VSPTQYNLPRKGGVFGEVGLPILAERMHFVLANHVEAIPQNFQLEYFPLLIDRNELGQGP
jgi:hypothetical protein